MKSNILDIEGKKVKEINLPSIFSAPIREDIVVKVLEAKKRKQPYAPSLTGGKHHSASGKMRHRRHVWQTHYGKGISRIPRKVMSRRGTQFNWVGAEVASTRGGRRAHPPKVISMFSINKINKKELRIALISALSATAKAEIVASKYKRLEENKISHLPFIVEGKIASLKTKELISSVKKILGDDLFEVALKIKTQRAGIGKMRGRRYKSNAGLLIIVGNNEELKANVFEIKNLNSLSVNDLAKGGLGRLTLYTEQAIKEIDNKLSSKQNIQSQENK
ncbi:MAG: 50S ribosomal protein L4 [Nanoarchaeota archaeon]